MNSYKVQSDVLKDRWRDPRFRRKMSGLLRKRWRTRKFRKRVCEAVSEAQRRRYLEDPSRLSRIGRVGGKKGGRAFSERMKTDPRFRRDVSERFSKQLRRWWRDPKFSEAAKRAGINNLRLGRKLKPPSKCQVALFRKLKRKFDGLVLEHKVGSYSIDMALPQKSLGIEVDGAYWHRSKRRDRHRDRILKGFGWKILRIPFPFTNGYFEKAVSFLENY